MLALVFAILAGVLSPVTPEALDAAVAGVRDVPHHYDLGQDAEWGNVAVSTPLSRLAAATWQARKNYKTVSEADAAELVKPELGVCAFLSRDFVRTNQVTRVVVKDPDGTVIQPVSETKAPYNGRCAGFGLTTLVPGSRVVVVFERPIEATFVGEPAYSEAELPVSSAFVQALK